MTLPACVDSSGVVALFVNDAVVFSDAMLVTATVAVAVALIGLSAELSVESVLDKPGGVIKAVVLVMGLMVDVPITAEVEIDINRNSRCVSNIVLYLNVAHTNNNNNKSY